MGKKSVWKEKYESQKDSVKDYIDAPNEALGAKPYVDVNGHKDENKKRNSQLDSAEKLHEVRTKGKRGKYDGEICEPSDKERKKDKSELELDWTGMEMEFLKGEKTKDVSEASEIGNEKEKRKDRKKEKRDKHDADDIEVEEVSNGSLATEMEKARKDNKILDSGEVSEVGCEKMNKKKKDRKSKKDENDVEPNGVRAVSRDTNVRNVEKGSKKSKRTKSDIEASEVSEAPNDEQNSMMQTIDLQTSDTKEKNKKKKKVSGNFGDRLQESEADSHKPVDASCGTEDSNKGRKKKAKSVKKVSDGKVEEVPKTNMSKNSLEKVTRKRVSFSDQVGVFPSSDGPCGEENANKDGPSYLKNAGKDGMVRGKPFKPEEDEIVKKSRIWLHRGTQLR